MAKPWARYEQNYINHPKFLALTPNAICLWLEGKNYCDMHQTDGMIPREALKTFRFNSPKSKALLMGSCGFKPNGEHYAPLWVQHPVGFKMHDYLDHNDCRDEVLARIADAENIAEVRRAANRERQQRFREDRKRQADSLRSLRNAENNVTSHTPTHVVVNASSSSSLERTNTDLIVSQELADRAARFLERYDVLYSKNRHGAKHFRRQPAIDHARAIDLCRVWDDARLEKLAVILLTTDDDWIAHTDRGFAVFASKATWCDERLSEWEAKRKQA